MQGPRVALDTQQVQQQLARIIGSSEFSQSRQARQLLSFVCEAALQGRDHLDQVEIARTVLGRGDFNPADDTSVRKLASVTRQKLASYYRSEGRSDPFVITLPPRQYVARIDPREEVDQACQSSPLFAESSQAPETAAPRGRTRLPLWLLGAAGTVVLAVAIWSRFGAPPLTADERTFVMRTTPGDVMNRKNDLPPDGILCGTPVSPEEEAFVRMRFTPTGGNQQAGVMLFDTPDRYVKFGRRFWSRANTEFALEQDGSYAKIPGTYAYDPRGEDGSHVWLAIRRAGSELLAFRSFDDHSWEQVGNRLPAPQNWQNPRTAIFSMQEDSNHPPTTAAFDQPATGLSFHHRAAGPIGDGLGLWKTKHTCVNPPIARIADGALEYQFQAERCNWFFLRDAPPGDWIVLTRLDFLPNGGATAGLHVGGEKGWVRLVRWSANNGSIGFHNNNQQIVTHPDFPGTPPVLLELRSKGGKLGARFSRDGDQWITLPVETPLANLGPKVQVGLRANFETWSDTAQHPTAKFHYVRQMNRALSNFR